MASAGEAARLLLDEMFTPRIAEALRELGVDCRSIAEQVELRALDDAEVLEAALTQGRTLVTNNVGDFEALRRARIAERRGVPPLIFTSDRAFPRDRRFVQRLVEALAVAARENLATAYGGVCWLTPGDQK